mmetsp:Transcript_9601/g.29203  ORF Transcript_9601/g.29203 Transcript_9601/m.29203 type:complete len:226 (-) Transcript_9601:101-778(-)
MLYAIWPGLTALSQVPDMRCTRCFFAFMPSSKLGHQTKLLISIMRRTRIKCKVLATWILTVSTLMTRQNFCKVSKRWHPCITFHDPLQETQICASLLVLAGPWLPSRSICVHLDHRSQAPCISPASRQTQIIATRKNHHQIQHLTYWLSLPTGRHLRQVNGKARPSQNPALPAPLHGVMRTTRLFMVLVNNVTRAPRIAQTTCQRHNGNNYVILVRAKLYLPHLR